MFYVCKTKHIKTGEINVFRTIYDFEPGDIIYPHHLGSKYPGHNENRHKVIVCVPIDSLNAEQRMRLCDKLAAEN